MYMYLYLYLCVFLYVCIYVFMCICMYLYLYTYQCIFVWVIYSHFFSHLPFSLICVLTWGAAMKIRCLYRFMLFISVNSNILTSAFIFYFLTSLLVFIVCFYYFFLLRLIFRFNKFVIFQSLYSFLWLVFIAKEKLSCLNNYSKTKIFRKHKHYWHKISYHGTFKNFS